MSQNSSREVSGLAEELSEFYQLSREPILALGYT